ncbi:bifunctional 2',3'-cyclic-nucleotide 2'-phosphodiesterase/3'-nucleotidase [Hyphomicrobium sp. 2TAF46]|uniref:bifunctional 2',3'-cyclic-nucleotide 2'-phosphodiesterase/3'-nucleotidase n=1 Tax=Hyphomicrobium sp. 2TAF46 TaxID=3233019 RepID=UPI003F8FB139
MTASAPLTRRSVIAGLASLTGSGIITDAAAEPVQRIELRLLETSDLHMFVLAWDYYRARPDPTVGFAKVASLIATARQEAKNTLLFDNGDFLQGNPLADLIVEQPDFSRPHPIVEIMGSLGYDAGGLGNHEFNFGLPFLEKSLAKSAMPFVCANVVRSNGDQFIAPHTILTKRVEANDGSVHSLRIGVIGFVPPQIVMWDRPRLEGRLASQDIVETARRLIPEIRARCDVLVALCHSGINAAEWKPNLENASFHLAGVPGIDVIMTGHSHRVFPGPDYVGLAGVDAVNGRLQGIPAVMPGFWGSHLGVVDLVLKNETGKWMVESAKVETRPIYRREKGAVEELAPSAPVVVSAIEPRHRTTLTWVERPCGSLANPVNSYFVWTGYDPATAIVNAAQLAYARPLLADTPYRNHPLLSVAAPFRAGYTPDSFIDLPAGQLAFRQIADLYIYSSNVVSAVAVTGAQIIEWLEFAARAFNTIDPRKEEPQALIDKRIPSYNFDVIAGLSYQIDVTVPPRYDGQGQLRAENRRIRDLRFEGAPIDPMREFVVVTNNYRADGGGGFAVLSGVPLVLRAPDTNRDAVVAYFKTNSPVSAPTSGTWSFAKTGNGVTVHFDTAEGARAYASGAGVEISGPGAPGYLRAQFKLPSA